MGVCSLTETPLHQTVLEKGVIQKSEFWQKYPIGKGGFGRVWKVIHKRTQVIYAMKEISKVRAIAKNSIPSIICERNLLSSLKHPFLINMTYAFQTKENFYIILDYWPGGDLRFHIPKSCNKKQKFNEENIKFLVSNIWISLKYWRQKRVIHRDLKPENWIFDKLGYLHLTDFGIAKQLSKTSKIKDTSGTPCYMSPESWASLSQSYASDYFSLGIIIYELIYGRRPYLGKTRKELRDSISIKQILLKPWDLPKGDYQNNGEDICDFINRWWVRKRHERLGEDSIDDIINHKWWKDVNWEKINNFTLPSPFISMVQGDTNFSQSNINKKDDIDPEKYANDLTKLNKSKLCHGYYYDNSPKGSTSLRRQASSISETKWKKHHCINDSMNSLHNNDVNKAYESTRYTKKDSIS